MPKSPSLPVGPPEQLRIWEPVYRLVYRRAQGKTAGTPPKAIPERTSIYPQHLPLTSGIKGFPGYELECLGTAKAEG